MALFDRTTVRWQETGWDWGVDDMQQITTSWIQTLNCCSEAHQLSHCGIPIWMNFKYVMWDLVFIRQTVACTARSRTSSWIKGWWSFILLSQTWQFFHLPHLHNTGKSDSVLRASLSHNQAIKFVLFSNSTQTRQRCQTGPKLITADN